VNEKLLSLVALTLVIVMAPLTAFSKEGVLEPSSPDPEATHQAPWVNIESVENVDSVSPDGNWATNATTLINLTDGSTLPLHEHTGLSGWCGKLWAPDSSRFYSWNVHGDLYVVHISSGEELLAANGLAQNCYNYAQNHISYPNFVTENYTIVFRNELYNLETVYRCISALSPNGTYHLNSEPILCRTDYLDIEFELIGFSSNTGKIIGIHDDSDLVLINDKVYNYADAPEAIDSIWTPAEDRFKVDANGLIGIDVNQDGRADYWDYDADGVVSISDLCPFTPDVDVADELGCSWGQYDGDHDGIYNILDAFPDDACASLDTDDDGKPDNILRSCETSLVLDVDDDNDGHDDREDACPTQGTFDLPDWIDTDADGICNEQDSDDDGDGYSDWDELSACGEVSDHLDPGITPTDTDSDGVCDFQDNDDDGDGYSDWDELSACGDGEIYDHLDPDITPPDTDSDGVCDFRDNDDDGDGWRDYEEIMCEKNPLKPSSHPVDTDHDGSCNHLDSDDDNDGFPDDNDAFPLDPDEHMTWWEKLLEFLLVVCCVLPTLLVVVGLAPK